MTKKYLSLAAVILALGIILNFVIDGFYKATNILETNQEAVQLTASNYSKIAGTWVSLDDDKYIIKFDDGYKTDLYSDSELSKEKFDFYREYPKTEDSIRNKRGRYLFVGEGEDQLAYELKMLNEEYLEMIYLDRGNTLRFNKSN